MDERVCVGREYSGLTAKFGLHKRFLGRSSDFSRLGHTRALSLPTHRHGPRR